MQIEDKIRQTLFEKTMVSPSDPGPKNTTPKGKQEEMNPADPGSGAGGGKIGFKVNEEDKTVAYRKKDARRKRRERRREKRLSEASPLHQQDGKRPRKWTREHIWRGS